ncbi:MAG: MFS transporter [Candidatus Binatia bacterium]|nr:MFS transporter [Candidatus Binatia bacterium]
MSEGESQNGNGPLGETWRAWVALGVGVVVVSAHSALAYGMSPLLKPITEELGWTRSTYAGAMNARLLILMLVVPFAGRLVDGIGARTVLSIGAVSMAIGTLAIANMDSVFTFWASGIFIGPGQAAVGSVAGSALVLREFRRRRGLAIGILNGGDNLITGLVHVASAYLLIHVGWRGAVTGLAFGYVLLAVLVFTVLKPGEGKGDDERDATVQGRDEGIPWRDSRLWLLLGSYVVIYGYVTTIGIHFPAYQRDLGRTPDTAAWIYGLSTMVGAAGSILIGWTTERITARATLRVVVLGLLASTFLLWFPVGVAAYTVWAAGYGIVNAGAVALLALLLAEMFGNLGFGRLMGVAISICMGATIIANFFAAGIFDSYGSYVPVWQTYSGLLLLTLVPVHVLARRPD